jgi:uncharacterized protein YndB with AHSA1/START domain
MTDALRVSFEVGCGVEHAFAVWTKRIGTWWPADHTLSGGPAMILLEGRVGGRIYERTTQGKELDWGLVTVWRPPSLLAYRWHLGSDPDSATNVEVTFSTLGPKRTRVQIEQTGWELLGAAAAEQRGRNRTGWESLRPHFCAAAEG